MVARQPQNFQRRINNYVPVMGYAADVIENGPSRFSLGTPALAVLAGILNDTDIATAGSTTALLVTELSGTYGRNLTYSKPTGAATGTVTVTGRDYLGQPMKETKTLLTGTGVVQGTKAFKYIDEVSWTANAGSTLDLGFGSKLGVPYVIENFCYAYENGIKTERSKDLVTVRIDTSALGGAATFSGRSPVRGNIIGTRFVTLTAVDGDNALTIDVNGGTAITGLAATIASAGSAAGVTYHRSVANATANCAVLAGDVINITTDGGGTVGAVEVDVIILPFAGVATEAVYTDPQTATTGDPRGLYEPVTTLDGVIEIEIVYHANRDVNASSHGGLHGISQYFA